MIMTQQVLKCFFYYDKETGLFTRLIGFGRGTKGSIAGKVNSYGYIEIVLFGERHRAHRLAFLYMTGKWPSEVDHINRVRSDNRWCNLREVTRAENMNNRKNNIIVTLDGVDMCLGKACKLLNLNYAVTRRRITKGHFTVEEALSIGKIKS